VEEALSPLETLQKAQETVKRFEVRQRTIERQHLQGLGRQLLSTKPSAPEPQFGFRATQNKKAGDRITWEESAVWQVLDVNAQFPGPGTYKATDEAPVQACVIDVEERFPAPTAPLGPAPPTTRDDLEPLARTSTPNKIYEGLKHKRRPAYTFNISDVGTRFGGGTGKRLQGFRDLREQMPAPSAAAFWKSREPEARPHFR